MPYIEKYILKSEIKKITAPPDDKPLISSWDEMDNVDK
ncbi:hypothetical protein ACZ87_02346 [Candidatus Erwinia dacicola]|uniref:Uncharacterized protein n=1 Tax=Candidatus Erwinia dacicola TaxID=252393 RepID=A0A328TN67_9GAMM|nr:hypothetical protein ACZ87_02346 [Candidatus Erwinia dacicola]